MSDNRTRQDTYSGETLPYFMELTAVLRPGDSDIKGTVQEWNEDDSEWVESVPKQQFYVSDPFYQNCVITGERVWGRWVPESGRVEAMGSQGLIRWVKMGEDVANAASGEADIVGGDGTVVSNSAITIENWSADLAVDDKVLVEYFPDDKKWRPIAHATGTLKVYKTPSNGISGATMPNTVNKGLCERMDWDDNSEIFVPSGDFENVYSHVQASVAGDTYISAQLIGKTRFVIVEDCDDAASWRMQ